MRIVEFESNQLEMDGQSVNAEVELWDCSGDRRFETCWPAIRHRANGAIFVCDPTAAEVGRELLLWYTEFAAKGATPHSNLMVLLHSPSSEKPTNDSAIAEFRMPREMDGVACIAADMGKGGGEELRLEFNNFLCNIIADVRRTDG